MKSITVVVMLAGSLFTSCLRAQPIELEFIASAPEFEAATAEYRSIWQREGDSIVDALRRYSGAEIPDRHIRVIVLEGVSNSGRVGDPLRLRASYAEPIKRATLSHELLHRYLSQVPGLPSCYPEIHDIMAVILFELWSELWGEDFAFEQADVESMRSQRYRASWAKSLALSQSERKLEIAGIHSCPPLPARSSGPAGRGLE